MWEVPFARQLLNLILSEVSMMPGELRTTYNERYFKDSVQLAKNLYCIAKI